MTGSISSLRREISTGSSSNIDYWFATARDLTAGIDGGDKAARLHDSLVEALQMIPVAEQLGFERIARQHALSILLSIEAALV